MLVLLLTAIFHVAVPLVLLAWQRLARPPTRPVWLTKTVFIGAYLVLLLVAGVWMAVPWYLGYLYLAGWAVLAFESYPRRPLVASFSPPPRSGVRPVLYGLLGTAFLGIAFYALAGHRAPDGTPVELAFPLNQGTYYIASGGSNRLMNLHLTKREDVRYPSLRGQSQAIDVVRLNGYRLRARPFPEKLSDYAIFGEPVYAPCSGTVVATDNEVPDFVPPQRDTINLPGNFVAIDCNGVRVVLAHLKQGSVRVVRTEEVKVGQQIGLIGNSGNSSEPHLHVHAERPGEQGALFDAEPVPMHFDGRYLARNDRFGSTSEDRRDSPPVATSHPSKTPGG